MKKILIGLVVVVIVGIVFVLSIGRAPKDVQRAEINDSQDKAQNSATTTPVVFNENLQKSIEDFDLSKLNFKFTGYGPGKSHEGTFNGISIANIEHNNDYITKGTIKFFTESVDTGIDKLDTHLCAENFFDCAKYKEIQFTITNVTRKSVTALDVTGDLTMKGITKQVTFEVKQDSVKLSSDFILDVNQFGFTAPDIVDNEVRIQFDTSL